MSKKVKPVNNPVIGFIGQGFIGKNYSDDFEDRGYKVVRYSKEKKYIRNKGKIKECDLVFIAVPTPTTPTGVDFSMIEDAIEKATVSKQVIIIKSTLQVGMTDRLQKKFKDRFILHSPEFLTEKTAKYDAAHPVRNIMGYTEKSKKFAYVALNVLPDAVYSVAIPCKEAELVKYSGNIWFFFKVICMNLVYDIAEKNGLNYDIIKDCISADPRIGATHLDVLHQGGRGAGGHCFIKDFEAFREMYHGTSVEPMRKRNAEDLMAMMSFFNRQLLFSSNKDLDLLKGVFGKKIFDTDISDTF